MTQYLGQFSQESSSPHCSPSIPPWSGRWCDSGGNRPCCGSCNCPLQSFPPAAPHTSSLAARPPLHFSSKLYPGSCCLSPLAPVVNPGSSVAAGPRCHLPPQPNLKWRHTVGERGQGWMVWICPRGGDFLIEMKHTVGQQSPVVGWVLVTDLQKHIGNDKNIGLHLEGENTVSTGLTAHVEVNINKSYKIPFMVSQYNPSINYFTNFVPNSISDSHQSITPTYESPICLNIACFGVERESRMQGGHGNSKQKGSRSN